MHVFKTEGQGMAEKIFNVMFIGDVVGTPGLNMVELWLKNFIRKYSIEFVICNGENAHHGKGMSLEALNQLVASGDWVLKQVREQTRFIIVDMHAEATAEKIALGWYLDGRVSAVIGTHTHVQTADERILPKGTGYCSDAGMTGPHASVIGMQTKTAVDRMIYQTPHKYECAVDDVHFSGIVLSLDAETGRTVAIRRIFYPEFERGEMAE